MPPDHSPRIRRSGFSTLHNCLRCKGLSTSAGSWLGFHEEACLQSPCRPPGRQRGAGVEAWSRGGDGGVGGELFPWRRGLGRGRPQLFLDYDSKHTTRGIYYLPSSAGSVVLNGEVSYGSCYLLN